MLDETATEVLTERNSRKEPLTDNEATALLAAVRSVVVARGRSTRELASKDASPDDLKGPTGNYRAPLVRVGRTLLVGFHEDSLRRLLTQSPS